MKKKQQKFGAVFRAAAAGITAAALILSAGADIPFTALPVSVEAAEKSVKRPAKREKSFCQKVQYLCGFHPFLTKGLNCEKWVY